MVIPNWLASLLGEKLFNPCLLHECAKKNEKKIFCLDYCSTICPHCLPTHRLLQVGDSQTQAVYLAHKLIKFMDKANERELKRAELFKKLEDDLVTYDEIKQVMRTELAKRLEWGYKPTHQQQLAHLLDFAHALEGMKIANEIKTLASEVYETPLPFLEIVLGPAKKLSSCLFEDESTTLEQAEIAMLDLYFERAQIRDGMSVLDLGCGWGSVGLHIARKYKNCHVTCVTNSISQKQYIENQCKLYNLSNVKIILADIVAHDTDDTFDVVLIIGVIEHMKNYALLLNKISKWMAKDGLLFVEHLCHKTFPYHFEPLDEDDWYSNFVFPTGTLTMPSVSFLLYFQADVSILNHWILSGKNFSRTFEEFLKRIDANIDAIKDGLKPSLGSEGVAKLISYWRGFCLTGMEMFGYNNGEEWMVSQVLFKKK